MIGFVSKKLGGLIRDDVKINQEMICLIITDKDLEMSSSQLILKEELEDFVQKLGNNSSIHVDELNLLSIPSCGKCIKKYLEKNTLIPKNEEFFLTWIE